MKPVTKTLLRWLMAAAIISGILILFPPFHIVPLDQVRAAAQSRAFNPSQFASEFLKNQLTVSLNNAFEARDVLDAIRLDHQSAKTRYARIVGLGGPGHYFLKGTGRIIALSQREVEISLNGNDSGQADIVLLTSMIFGNEVLNATGLVSRSQFPRTNDYNAISAQVNTIVETQIVPPFLEKAKIGAKVHFVGCSTQISDDDPMPIPMRLVPVKLEVD